MKTLFGIILCGLVLGGNPLAGMADVEMELIVNYATGHINWTRGEVVSKGICHAPLEGQPASRGTLSDQAFKNAISNLLGILARVRVDDDASVADIIARADRTRDEVGAMAAAADIVDTFHRSDGGVEVTVQMVLHGGFAQLMLPEEIRQVENIKPISGNAGHSTDKQAAGIGKGPYGPGDAETFTGLVVDARGIGAQPSMVPVLLDENGQEVYSPAFISREFAVQYGVCQYRRLLGNAEQASRLAPRPLLVKGLRAGGRGPSRVVISNADAAKLRSSSAHLGFLKQCRVIILMD